MEIIYYLSKMMDGHKVCNKCNELKPFDDFYKRKDNILRLDCKICCGIRNKKNNKLRPKDGRYKDGRYNEYKKQWKKNKREKDKVIRERDKLIKKQEKEKEVELLKSQKETNRLEKIEEGRLEKIRMIEEGRLEKIRIREEYLKSDEYKESLKLRKEKKNIRNKNQKKRRMKTDPLYRFRKLLSNNIRNSFYRGGFSKVSRTYEILGDEWFVIKEYFESKFTEGMSWAKVGKEIHCDHIVPLAAFDLNKEEDQRAAHHYTNLQPLWASENQKKHAKVTFELLEKSMLVDTNIINRIISKKKLKVECESWT